MDENKARPVSEVIAEIDAGITTSGKFNISRFEKNLSGKVVRLARPSVYSALSPLERIATTSDILKAIGFFGYWADSFKEGR